MAQLLHGRARTTAATRAAIQHSTESLQKLATRYGINPKTVAKWRKRTTTTDERLGPLPASTVLTAVQNGGVNLYIGCENPGTETVYFDDFRLQPVQAPMTAYVYDAHTHQRTHTLDGDNLYNRTEYDIAGQGNRRLP